MSAFFLALLVWMTAPSASSQTAIREVRLIDGTGNPPRTATVLIEGNRIVAIGDPEIPESATVIDGTGKTLIPGLWDMHIHWYDGRFLGLFIANGVTGARNMFGTPMLHQTLRKNIQAGSLIGPRLNLASPIVDGPQPVWPGSVAVADATAGREAVGRSVDQGWDFVKVYSMLSREAFFAIADEAKKRDIPFAGHVPPPVSLTEAVDAGMLTVEHMYGFLLACSSEGEAMLAEIAEVDDPRDAFGLLQRRTDRLIESYDPERAEALGARLAASETWLCPTLTVLRNLANMDDPAMAKDPRMAYMPPFVVAMWDPAKDFRLQNRTAEDWALVKRSYALRKEILGVMARKGVKIVAGTDVLNPYCFPGFSLHEELVLLVEAGLTPMAAIQSATIEAARVAGRDKELGTIEVGKLADLVLLEADPLADIANTQTIHAVVFDGRYSDRAALDAMLEETRRLAAGNSQ